MAIAPRSLGEIKLRAFGARAAPHRRAHRIACGESYSNRAASRVAAVLAKPAEQTLRAKEIKRVERLQRDAQQLRDWLLKNPKDHPVFVGMIVQRKVTGGKVSDDVEYLDAIQRSAGHLAVLVDDLGLSTLAELKPMLERTFRHVAEATKLAFLIDLRAGMPETIPTDPQRLQQILNNLLSNAFKFTEKGRVEFVAEMATSGWSPSTESLTAA